jgi:chaperonin GroES
VLIEIVYFPLFQNGEHVPLSVKVGDQVLLPEYGGTKVELEENKEFHLFRESDILAKLES